jgi:prevent-host-death family protein
MNNTNEYYPSRDSPYWQLQEAKAMFSKVVRSAEKEPQIITVHGKESAVVISIDSYRKLSSPKESLVGFMENSPWAYVKTGLSVRQAEKMRRIEL